MKRLASISCLVLLFSSLSHAAVIINFNEVGGDVVSTSSGTINTAGFDFPDGLSTSKGFLAGTSVSSSWFCVIGTGSSAGSVGAYVVSNFTSDNTEVCYTGSHVIASINSGDYVGVISRAVGSNDGVYVPLGYVSGDPISGSSTWSGTTIAGLGLVTGTYVFTWGSGADADSLTLNIGGSAPPPSTYTIGGSISGLTGSVTLQNNGADNLVSNANGGFTFATALSDGTAYAVTVSTQPTGQTCTISNGSGTVSGADVTDVGVSCADDVPIAPPAPIVPIPTMSEWALILLTMLLGLMVFTNRKRLF